MFLLGWQYSTTEYFSAPPLPSVEEDNKVAVSDSPSNLPGLSFIFFIKIVQMSPKLLVMRKSSVLTCKKKYVIAGFHSDFS